MMMVSGAARAMMPVAPSITSRVATSSATIDSTNDAPAAASPGPSATRAPASASAWVLVRSRLQIRSAKPAPWRFIAMREPIAPRPTNATSVMGHIVAPAAPRPRVRGARSPRAAHPPDHRGRSIRPARPERRPPSVRLWLRAGVGEQLDHALDPRAEHLPARQIGEVAEPDDHQILRRHDHHELTLVALRGEQIARTTGGERAVRLAAAGGRRDPEPGAVGIA